MEKDRFRPLAWVVLGYSLVVILWGYFLRVSESGDGCGTDWPLCLGSAVPSEAAFPTWVEYIHRVSSGAVLLLVIGMALWARRRFEPGHAVRTAAGASLLLTVTESLFGAALVVFGLVATDVSTARIAIRPFHVVNTFSLMAALALTAWWAQRGIERFPSWKDPRGRGLVLALGGLLLIAATGSWTGLAGTAFPAETLAEGIGQYLDPEHLLIYLRVTHPVVALIVVALVGRMAISLAGPASPPAARRFALAACVFLGLQLVLGPLTIVLLYPTALRLVHLAAADLLWISLVLLASEVLSASPERSSRPPPGSARTQPGAARP
jgi:heme A synthase